MTVQTGWVERHGDGWRGGWRHRGTKRYTSTLPRKGDARRALNDELRRLDRGLPDSSSLTLSDLIGRFSTQHAASERTREKIQNALRQPLSLWGDLHPGQVTPEAINRWLVTSDLRPSTRQTYLGALRQVYNFAVDNRLIDDNPARRAKTPTVRRSDGLLPFQSWTEVVRVAEEAGRWGPFIILAADTGARPGELRLLQHRHVAGRKVFLPGTKTRRAQRIVTLTPRGVAAYSAIAVGATPLVFTTNGRPLDLHNWRSRVWYPALDLAGFEPRGPYQLRHTFAYFSLRAGVPIADLSFEMGHESIRLTLDSYGHWSDEIGDRAADLRTTWGYAG